MRALALLLLASCVTIPPQPVACVSRCGMTLFTPRTTPTPNCLSFQDVEDRSISAFSSLAVVEADPRFSLACQRLRHWSVEIGDSVQFHPQTGERTAGFTLCDYRRVIIGHRDDLARSALAHELGHAIQGCTPVPPFGADHQHSNWGAIDAALRDMGFP